MATVPASSRTNTITLALATAGPFSVGFRMFDTDALTVFLNGVPVTNWAMTASFTDGYTDAATILFDAALASGDVIIIDGDMAADRQEDYLNGPGLTASMNVEQARHVVGISEAKRDTKRSLRFLKDIDPIKPVPGTAFTFDEDGNFVLDPSSKASMEAAQKAAEEAEAAANAVRGGTRAAFVILNATRIFDALADGSTIMIEGHAYEKQAASTEIPDLPGWVPGYLASLAHYGAVEGDSTSTDNAIDAIISADRVWETPEGYWPNDRDATFSIYPGMRNYSAGGIKLKRGLPGSGTTNYLPLIHVEKASNAQREAGGTKYFDSAVYAGLTLDTTATAFGAALVGYVRSSAGDRETSGASIDAIAVHGSGKSIGKNGRTWGGWFQGGNGDDGSGIRSSQIIGVEINLVNAFASQPHPENLPTGEGPYRGLVVTTADGGTTSGIGIDIGDGSGLAYGASGWWIGMRLRRDGVLASGTDWKTNYLTETQQLKIEGATSLTYRYGGIRIGPRNDGVGTRFTYGINMVGATFQDDRAIHLGSTHKIYFGDAPSTDIAYLYKNVSGSSPMLDLHNMLIGVNGLKVVHSQLAALPAAATDLTSVITLLNALRAGLTTSATTHGLFSAS